MLVIDYMSLGTNSHFQASYRPSKSGIWGGSGEPAGSIFAFPRPTTAQGRVQRMIKCCNIVSRLIWGWRIHFCRLFSPQTTSLCFSGRHIGSRISTNHVLSLTPCNGSMTWRHMIGQVFSNFYFVCLYRITTP